LIVADSSYLVERLLESRRGWGQEELIAPDIAVLEVVKAVLVQQRDLHSLKDGTAYIKSLFEAIDCDSLRLVSVTEPLVEDAYGIALRNGDAIYDCIFVALALRYGSELKTNDRRQEQVLASERSQGVKPHFR
jgi:predicted nucleic acid-binding protein